MTLNEIVCSVASRYIGKGPYSVTHKKQFDLTDDRHDYVSGRLYWWKDGETYVRRDGQPNPANRGENFDRQRLEDMINGVVACVIAWEVTGDDGYANDAVHMLNVWFVDSETRMNPHLEYGQFVPGKKSSGIGIIDTYDFYYLVDAIEALGARSFLDLSPFKVWFDQYLNWLITSDQGKSEASRKNNHGTSHHLQSVRYAEFVGKKWKARYWLWQAKRKRIDIQIDDTGKQPLESDRSISFYYHVYNYTKLLHLAERGKKQGVDLACYKGKMKKAFDYISPYLDNQQAWPLEQIREVDDADLIEMVITSSKLFNIDTSEYLLKKDPKLAVFRLGKQVKPPPTLLREYLKYL